MSEDLLKNARKWLDENGFPFELHCAFELKQAGFKVGPHCYFIDDSEGTAKPREIDILAWRSLVREHGERRRRVELEAVVECKVAKAPWIAFVDRTSISGDFDSYPKHLVYPHKSAKAAFDVIASLLKGKPMPVAKGLRWGHSSIITMSKSGKDHAFDAMAKVLKAAEATVSASTGWLTVVGVPIILVDGPLISCRLGDSGEIELEQVDHLSLTVSGFTVKSRGSLVECHVVARKAVPTFARALRETLDTYLDVIKDEDLLLGAPAG